MKEQLVECPICKKKYWSGIAIKNHIIRMAQCEIWRKYICKYHVETPHFDYYITHLKETKTIKFHE